MAPRGRKIAKAPLAAVDGNASAAMTPRRAEVTALKDENEALKNEMATLTALLVKVQVKEAGPEAPAPAAAVAPAAPPPLMPQPNLALLEMPAAPAKPVAAFSLFCSSVRPTLGGMTAPEQARAMGAQWKALGEADRAPFAAAAAAGRARYDGELARHKTAAAKVQLEKDALMMMYEARRQRLALEYYDQQVAASAAGGGGAAARTQQMKKEGGAADGGEDAAAPKKARTAYNLYCADRRAALAAKGGPALAFGDAMKQFAAEWAALDRTAAGRKKAAKYGARAAADRARYAGEAAAAAAGREEAAAAARAAAAAQLAADKDEAMRLWAPRVRAAAAEREGAAAARAEKRARRAARAERRAEGAGGRGGRARSAYVLFGMAVRAEVAAALGPGAAPTMVMAEIGRRWKAAGEAERADFVAAAAAERAAAAAEGEGGAGEGETEGIVDRDEAL